MSDLQTALFSALKEWEPPEMQGKGEGTMAGASITPAPKTTGNMTRDCFAMVRDNPGITRTKAVQRLEDMGHKPKSTTSILSQMVKTKMISETSGALSTKRKNYTPLQTKVRKVDKAKPKAVELKDIRSPAGFVGKPLWSLEKQAAPEPQATPTPAPAPKPQRVSMNVDEWLDTVPLKTARQVYWKLHGIFGGQAI
jgi:hypothetical protein